jgi:hypothetical protein
LERAVLFDELLNERPRLNCGKPILIAIGESKKQENRKIGIDVSAGPSPVSKGPSVVFLM